MKLLFLCILSVYTCAALAASPNEPQKKQIKYPGKLHIVQMDENFPVDEFATGENIQIHHVGDFAKHQEMLPPSVQRRLFRQANLIELTKHWDAFDQDSLTIHAEQKSPQEVFQLFNGKIPIPNIEKLGQLVREYRKQKDKEAN